MTSGSVHGQLPFRSMLITDWSIGREALLELVERALAASPAPVAVQHRHLDVSTRVFLDEGRALAELCHRFGAYLFINARLEVALVLEAHLHLPTRGMRVADARGHLAAGRLISHAVHSFDEFQPGADLALVSPVFTPTSKPNDTRSTLGGPGFFRLAQQIAPCPAFALGGMTAEALKSLGPSVAGVAATNRLV